MSHDTPTAAQQKLDAILEGKITDPQEIAEIRERLKPQPQEETPGLLNGIFVKNTGKAIPVCHVAEHVNSIYGKSLEEAIEYVSSNAKELGINTVFTANASEKMDIDALRRKSAPSNVFRDDVSPNTISKLKYVLSGVDHPDADGLYAIYFSDHEKANKLLDQVFETHDSHKTNTDPVQLVLKVNDQDFATLQELGVNITKPKPKSIYDMGF